MCIRRCSIAQSALVSRWMIPSRCGWVGTPPPPNERSALLIVQMPGPPWSASPPSRGPLTRKVQHHVAASPPSPTQIATTPAPKPQPQPPKPQPPPPNHNPRPQTTTPAPKPQPLRTVTTPTSRRCACDPTRGLRKQCGGCPRRGVSAASPAFRYRRRAVRAVGSDEHDRYSFFGRFSLVSGIPVSPTGFPHRILAPRRPRPLSAPVKYIRSRYNGSRWCYRERIARPGPHHRNSPHPAAAPHITSASERHPGCGDRVP